MRVGARLVVRLTGVAGRLTGLAARPAGLGGTVLSQLASVPLALYSRKSEVSLRVCRAPSAGGGRREEKGERRNEKGERREERGGSVM